MQDSISLLESVYQNENVETIFDIVRCQCVLHAFSLKLQISMQVFYILSY